MAQFKILNIAVAVLLLTSLHLKGATEVEAVEPFVGDQTWLVARADLTGIDLNAARQCADQLADAPELKQFGVALRTDIDALVDRGRIWSDQFKKAGGKSIWTVVGVDADRPAPTVAIVVPLAAGSDESALTKLLSAGNAVEVVRAKDVLVARLTQSDVVRGPLERQRPRPELAAAFAAAGDAPLRIAFIPPEDGRRVLETMLRPLPDGRPGTVLTAGVKWAAIGCQFPPKPSVQIVLQSDSPAAAQALHALLRSLGDITVPSQIPLSEGFSPQWLIPLARALGPASRAQADRIQIELDQKAFGQAASIGVVWREQALMAESAGNIKQLLIACYVFANARKDRQFPDSLEQVVRAMELPSSVLIDPRFPDSKTGYLYIKPPKGLDGPPDHLVIYEDAKDLGPGINIGFRDGHVEWYSDQKEFNRLLMEARKAAKLEPKQ